MKTPREILLARHRDAGPDLDAIRARAVAGMQAVNPQPGFLDFLLSLRWHAAALVALWIIVALLGGEHPQSSPAGVAGQFPVTPPVACFLTLREFSEALDQPAEPPRRQDPIPVIPHASASPTRRETSRSLIA